MVLLFLSLGWYFFGWYFIRGGTSFSFFGVVLIFLSLGWYFFFFLWGGTYFSFFGVVLIFLSLGWYFFFFLWGGTSFSFFGVVLIFLSLGWYSSAKSCMTNPFRIFFIRALETSFLSSSFFSILSANFFPVHFKGVRVLMQLVRYYGLPKDLQYCQRLPPIPHFVLLSQYDYY